MILSPTSLVLTITITPFADGSGRADMKAEIAPPDHPSVDLLSITIALLNLSTQYLLSIQGAQSMLVGQKKGPEADG